MYSLITFLQESLFATWRFFDKRLELINRNWILHGRDDPNYWKEVDFLRLINTLSSIQFIKRRYKNHFKGEEMEF